MGQRKNWENGGKTMELNIESLTKHYGDLYALGDFTVCLRPGVYGLLGPNGAGKSTLMNLLTDTVKREAGSIRYNGKEILELGRGYRALVGYMPQQQGYYEEFTVGRFLYYMAALKGLSRSKARGEITEFLEVVGLSDCLHKKMGSLSGGMRQRILLVQALLGSPKVLLLDEPTAGLDPEERIRIRNYISAIATERIVLLATHVVSDVESIAEEILLLRRGQLLARDPPAALVDQTRPFVSELLCLPEELPQIQNQYRISNISQYGSQLLLRLVGPNLPPPCFPDIRVGLDEVYLYFMNWK